MLNFVIAHWAAILALSVSAAVPGFAEQSSIARDPLVLTLRTVTASAQERIPFTSIRGSANAGLNGWSSTKNLPAASSCAIRQVPASGQEPTQATYQCTWKYDDGTQAEKAYRALFEKILLSGDWMGRPYKDERSLKDAVFDASTGARVGLHIFLMQGSKVGLAVSAGTTNGFSFRSVATQDAKRSGDTAASQEQEVPPKPNGHVSGQQSAARQHIDSGKPADAGVLAVESDRAGTLFVDGERKAAMVPDKVVSLKLMPGQHFVDLRDANGSKLWEKIVTISKGEQVVSQIVLVGKVSPREKMEPEKPRPQLRRSTELFLLGRFPPVDCLSDESKCDEKTPADKKTEEQVKEICKEEPAGSDALTVAVRKSVGNLCASTLYVQAEYQQALTRLQAAMDAREYLARTYPDHFGANSKDNLLNPSDWGDILVLRGQITNALQDRLGALQDLTAGIEQYSVFRKQVEEWSHSSNTEAAEKAKELLTNPGFSLKTALAYQYRAVTLFRLGRYVEANRDYNKAISISSEPLPFLDELGNVIRAQLAAGSTEISSFGAGNGAGENVPASGDYSCDGGAIPCEPATVSVSGSGFSAKLESNPNLKDQNCDSIKFPPAPPPKGGCYGFWKFTGVIDGTSIEGTMSVGESPPDSLGCGGPIEWHKFKGTIKENGRVIGLTSEQNLRTFNYHDTRTFVWQKPHYVCDVVTVTGTEPVTFVLRSKSWR